MSTHSIQCTINDNIGGEPFVHMSMGLDSLSGDGAELMLNEEPPESATFEIPQVIEHDGTVYSLTVDEFRRMPDQTVVNGQNWVQAGTVIQSQVIEPQLDLIIKVVATDSAGNSVSGEGVINIRFMGKPLQVDLTEQSPGANMGVAS